jgi:hypothetical protein
VELRNEGKSSLELLKITLTMMIDGVRFVCFARQVEIIHRWRRGGSTSSPGSWRGWCENGP